MKLHKIVRNEKSVCYTIDRPNADGHVEVSNITAPEAPHPELDRALEALAPMVKKVMELSSVAGIAPYSLSLTYTKHGTRSAVIGFTRLLGLTGKTYRFATVSFQLDDPADGEEGVRACSKKEAELLVRVIEEGERYAKGERQQILLPLEDPNTEPTEGDGQPDNMEMFSENPQREDGEGVEA